MTAAVGLDPLLSLNLITVKPIAMDVDGITCARRLFPAFLSLLFVGCMADGTHTVFRPPLSSFDTEAPMVELAASRQKTHIKSAADEDAVVVRAQSSEDSSAETPSPVPLSTEQSPWIAQPSAAAATSPYVPVQYGAPMGGIPADPFVGGGMIPGGISPGGLGMATRWDAYLAGIFKAGDPRMLGQGQMMIPLLQNGREMLFADIRGSFDEDSNNEGNFGLGDRVMVNPYEIYGAYIFYDYKQTQNNNNFSQITIGTEYLTIPFEARLNGYIPLTGAKSAPGASVVTTPVGGGIFMRAGQERAFYGIDAEMGWLLADYGLSEFRGFIGGFHFDTDANGFRDITGPRARLELRSYGMAAFGPDTRLTLGAEYQWDEVRDSQVNFLARMVIPLGGPRPPQAVGGNRMHRRMYDRIVRDDDIVTVAAATGPLEVATDAATGIVFNAATTRVVNGATAGPNPVGTALATAGVRNVVVDGSAGTVNETATIAMGAGQRVLGAGIPIVGATTGSRAFYGTRPTVNNAAAGVNVFTMANAATIRGLNITGGLDGVFAGGALVGGNISGNNISGMAGNGINTLGLTNVLISGNTVTGAPAGLAGVFLGGNLVNTAVSGNTLNGNGFSGLTVNGTTDVSTTITGNTFSGNARNGLIIAGANSGVVSNNVASGNGTAGGVATDYGYWFAAGNAATGVITGNTASNNIGDGFFLGANGPVPPANAGNNAGTITGNTATANGANGFFFGNNLAGATFSGNTASGNGTGLAGLAGFNFLNNNVGATFNNNIATGNTGDGFQFNDNLATGAAGGGTFNLNNSTSNTGLGYNPAVVPLTAAPGTNTASGNTGGPGTIP